VYKIQVILSAYDGTGPNAPGHEILPGRVLTP
jgi:hypothetical protein